MWGSEVVEELELLWSLLVSLLLLSQNGLKTEKVKIYFTRPSCNFLRFGQPISAVSVCGCGLECVTNMH